jgi:hypothetical protein
MAKRQKREGELILTPNQVAPPLVVPEEITSNAIPQITGASLLSAIGGGEASILNDEFQQRLKDQPQPTIEDISRAPVTPEEAGGDQRAGLFNSLMETPAIEKLGAQELFPTSTLGFRQSSTSLPGFGQVNLFATSPIIPFGVIDAKARANERAATGRQKKLDELKSIFPEFEETAPQLQRRLNDFTLDSINGLFDDASKSFKGNSAAALEALNDPKSPWFRKRQEILGSLNGIASEGTDIANLVDDMFKTHLDKDKFIPPDVLDSMVKFRSGMVDFDKFAKDPTLFRKTKEKLQSYGNMINAVNTQVMPNLEADIENMIDGMTQTEIDVLLSTNDYTVISNRVREFISPERADSLASVLKTQSGLIQSKEEISDLITKMIGDRIKINPKVVTKFKGRGADDEEGALIRKEELFKIGNPSINNVEAITKSLRGSVIAGGGRAKEIRVVLSGDEPGYILIDDKGRRERVGFQDFTRLNDLTNTILDRKNISNQILSKVPDVGSTPGDPLDVSQHINPLVEGIQKNNAELIQKVVDTSPDISGIKFEESTEEGKPSTIIITTSVPKSSGIGRETRKILNDGSEKSFNAIRSAFAEFGVEDKIIRNLARRGENATAIKQGGAPAPNGERVVQDGVTFQWNASTGEYEETDQ